MSTTVYEWFDAAAPASPAFVTTVNPISFADPANVPASTTRIRFRARLRWVPAPGAGVLLFAQESTGCDLTVSGTVFRMTVEDGAGLAVITAFNTPVTIPTDGLFHTIEYDVDQVAQTATLTIDGTPFVKAFTAAGNGLFQSSREVSMLGNTLGSANWPASDFEFLEVFFTTSGVETLRKRIQASDGAAAIMADTAWIRGTGSVV